MQDPAGPKGSSTGLPAYQAPRPNLARTFPWPAGIRTPSMRSRRKFAPWSAARLPCASSASDYVNGQMIFVDGASAAGWMGPE